MDQYLSTYRKDYLWPYVRTYPLRNGPTYATDVIQRRGTSQGVPCTCGAETGDNIPPKHYEGQAESGSYEWSRLGPMGPLLDPKLYPAKTGSIPESEVTEFDQPNTYLKKLHEKYPYLYNILQSAPPSEMVRRVNIDRLRTTYQVEFSKMGEHSWMDVDEPESLGPQACLQKDIRPELDCRPHIEAALKNLAKTGSTPTNRGSFGSKQMEGAVNPSNRGSSGSKQMDGVVMKENDKSHTEQGKKTQRSEKNEEELPKVSVALPAWKSEYQDSIMETGRVIMKEKLHHFSKLSPGRRKLLAYCSL